jgi:hypothetical protein
MRFLLGALLACALAVSADGGDGFVVPKGIRYHKASKEANDAARKILARLFSGKATDKEVLAAFAETPICGPGLWRAIGDDPLMLAIKHGSVVFKTPVLDASGNPVRVVEMKGKIFQSSEEILAFWKAFSKKTDFSGLKIRRPNPTELRIFWAMIPFDITEPIFILDSGKHKILAVFAAAKNLRIMWIDDYQNISFEKTATGKKEKTEDGGKKK